jgi:Subtilase family/Peptidase inhibitor I9
VRPVRRRSVLICGTATVAFSLIGLGVALASAAHRTGPFKRAGHRGLAAGRILSTSRGTSSRVIVILRNQVNFAPATKRRIGQRIKAEAHNNAGIERQVKRTGGRIYKRYHALNAFAATVSSNERSNLQKSPAVAQVVPDTIVALPRLASSPATTSSGPNASASPSQAVCPSNPNRPLLEPEALQTTHTAFSDPSTPQAQNLATGTGVKVAFFADGLDINNPDLIRPDGSRVIIDYKDFSGDGPNAPTGAAEAFGDASSIAAQGREVYDISNFVNPAHPLPPGCNITVRGIAPGASLIAMKVFGNANTSFNSVILQGLDYALSNDHPNVISESFGGYPIPDTTQDLTRRFNEQAVAAGVTVVESSGDSGVESSPSSASSDPSVIAAGASTTFRNYAQGTQYGFQFAKGWLSDNISSIESAGFTMGGRVLDLVAPGEANWALCSAQTTTYEECVDYKGAPTNLQSFGGTSESAPLIAGGAALIIQAYRASHGGNSPSPALVRQLLTSTATDLHVSSVEEGAGELDTLAAVQAAKSAGNPTSATGQNLLVGPTQLDISGQAGTSTSRSVQVTNVGTGTQVVHAHARAITRVLSNQTGTVTLGSSPTFIDQFGSARPYQTIHFNVGAGEDRLLAFDSWAGPTARVGMTLIDPKGNFAAYTRPQGDGNHGEVDVHDPVAGQWTAIIFVRDGTFTGPVHWQFIGQDFGTVDSVSPSAQTIAPGQTRTFQLGVTLPSQAGDVSHDLVLDSSSGRTTIVPVALRSLVNLGSHGGSFSGDLIGGNGRNGAGQPGQIDTVDFNVPPGQPELSVALKFANDPGTEVYGALIDPTGSEITAGDNVHTDGAGTATFTNGLQAYVPSPPAGRWRFVVDVFNPVGGQVLSAPYHGQITFAAPPVSATGLPTSAGTILPAGKPATVTVSVNNNGAGTQDVFLDPRTPQRSAFSLLSITPDTNINLPIPVGSPPPLYLVPTETNRVDAAAKASEPVTFDFGFGDPDLAAISSGNSASATFSTREATPGLWAILPDPIGPFTGPAPAGTVSTGMVAHTLGFDLDTSSSTGDIWQQTVDPTAPAFSPVTLAPGQHGKLTLTITPSGSKGRTVRGTLFVDEFNNGIVPIGGELVALPYEYTVG